MSRSSENVGTRRPVASEFAVPVLAVVGVVRCVCVRVIVEVEPPGSASECVLVKVYLPIHSISSSFVSISTPHFPFPFFSPVLPLSPLTPYQCCFRFSFSENECLILALVSQMK